MCAFSVELNSFLATGIRIPVCLGMTQCFVSIVCLEFWYGISSKMEILKIYNTSAQKKSFKVNKYLY